MYRNGRAQLKHCLFLESEVYGREYFLQDGDGEEQLNTLYADAEAACKEDGITRRVGFEIGFEDDDEDETPEIDADTRRAMLDIRAPETQEEKH